MKKPAIAISFDNLSELFRQAEANNGEAIVELARALQTGFTVQADVDESHALLRRAEGLDCASAHSELGDFYGDKLNTGYYSVPLAVACYVRYNRGGGDVSEKLAMLFLRNEFREIAFDGETISKDTQWKHFLNVLKTLEASTSTANPSLLPYYQKHGGSQRIDALLDRLVQDGNAEAMATKGFRLLGTRDGGTEALRLFRKGARLGNLEALAGIFRTWKRHEQLVDATTAMYALRSASLWGVAQNILVDHVSDRLGLADMAAEYAKAYGVESRWVKDSIAQEVAQDLKFSEAFAHLKLAQKDRDADSIWEDFDAAFAELVPLSASNADAANDLALMYLLGFGVARNRNKAVMLLKDASLQGSKVAEYNYLLTQFEKWRSSTRISQVRKFMEETEGMWPAESFYYRGVVTQKDYSVPRNAERGDALEAQASAIASSIKYFEAAASKGHIGANLYLGYYEEAANLGSITGMIKLANKKIGRYTLDDFREEYSHAKQSVFIEAQAGDFSGAIDRDRSAVLDAARVLLQNAHANGRRDAVNGLLYLAMVQNCGKIALDELVRFSEEGNRRAQYELARNLELTGERENQRSAMRWYRTCYRNGYLFSPEATLSVRGMRRLADGMRR